ncbi:MAG: L-threonylcarbamoyladenylate synthase [Spirochaetota bacterium]
MIIYLHPDNPEQRKLRQISETLKKGGVYIFPTDTVYALVADAFSKEGVEKLYSLKKMDKNKPISIFCKDISEVSSYVNFVPNDAFKLMKKVIPGPFTFIFQANKKVPKMVLTDKKRKTVGVRIPSHIFIQELLQVHGSPLTSTSVFTDDEYVTDTEELDMIYGKRVNGIIDGGLLEVSVSTVLSFTGDDMEVIRAGKGAELLDLVEA